MTEVKPVAARPEEVLFLSDDAAFKWPRKVDLFGIGISVTDYDQAVAAIINAGRLRSGGIVSCHSAHAVVTLTSTAELRQVANEFQMITPDGQPVRWAINLLHDLGLRDRVYGPELMLRVCRAAAEYGQSIYLYGGRPGVLCDLKEKLYDRFPGLTIAGAEDPPFRPLTAAEEERVIQRIDDSGASILFIGLGCPKQDILAYHWREHIKPVQICVGAAFDFHAGAKKIAPAWMQARGIEWLFRLYQEPGRLWRRYLSTNSIFIMKILNAWLTKQVSSRLRH